MSERAEDVLDELDRYQVSPWRARGTLEAILEGDSPTLIARALEHTTPLVDCDEMARLHVSLVTDADLAPDIRGRAALALGPSLEHCAFGMWDEEMHAPPLSRQMFSDLTHRLRRIYFDAGQPPVLRRRVLETSVRAPEPWQHGAIRAAWLSADDDWRRTAVVAMGWLDGWESELSAALRADDPAIVTEAIRSAERSNAVAGFGDQCLAHATDASAPVSMRIVAIEALPSVRGPHVADTLDALADEEDPRIAESASWAKEEWKIRESAPDLNDFELPE
jgi:hypothetical protein